MAKGARTVADLERAIATLQRRSRAQEARIKALHIDVHGTRRDIDVTTFDSSAKVSVPGLASDGLVARVAAVEEYVRLASGPKTISITQTVGGRIGFADAPFWPGIIDPPLSPARTNSSPESHPGGSDLAGPGPLCRARAFLRSVRMWASSLFFAHRQTARDGNT